MTGMLPGGLNVKKHLVRLVLKECSNEIDHILFDIDTRLQ